MNPLSSAVAVSPRATSEVNASRAVSMFKSPRRIDEPSHTVSRAFVARIPRALLVGENSQGVSYLAKRLEDRGFQCEYASSTQQALSLVQVHGFDLILSPIRLRDASLYFLMDLFYGAAVTLFYFYGVEDGCWWLPALRNGKRCWGTPALRSSEFAFTLDAAIDEVRLGV